MYRNVLFLPTTLFELRTINILCMLIRSTNSLGYSSISYQIFLKGYDSKPILEQLVRLYIIIVFSQLQSVFEIITRKDKRKYLKHFCSIIFYLSHDYTLLKIFQLHQNCIDNSFLQVSAKND